MPRGRDGTSGRLDALIWPDLVILGGGASKKADKLLPRLDVRPEVVAATLLNEAGIVGAAVDGRRRPAVTDERAAPKGRRDAVLTTGANSGIGLATVIELARAGYRSIGSVRSNEKANVVRRAASDAGVEVETVLLDVTDEDACDAVFDDIGTDLYGLVNNAGYGMTGAIEDVTDEEARHLLETMVIAPMRLARLALPGMRSSGTGADRQRVVDHGPRDHAARRLVPGREARARSGVRRAASRGRAATAIHVALVEPGGFRTSIWEDMERDIEQRGDSRFGDRVPTEPAGHEAGVTDHG